MVLGLCSDPCDDCVVRATVSDTSRGLVDTWESLRKPIKPKFETDIIRHRDEFPHSWRSIRPSGLWSASALNPVPRNRFYLRVAINSFVLDLGPVPTRPIGGYTLKDVLQNC
jgi:hypothetical protein